MSITMKELAALAGMSHATVSLVLNGKANGRISPAKQQKVRELAAQHHYRANAAARGLRTGKQYTVGILLPTPKSPFYTDMAAELQSRLDEKGYTAIFSFWGTSGRRNVGEALGALRALDVAGIISWEFDEALLSEKLPIVLYAHHIKHPDVDHVMIDFESEVEQALEHLTSQGHTKFGFIGNVHDVRSVILQRKLSERNLPFRKEHFIDNELWHHPVELCVEELLSQKEQPTAILSPDDLVTAQVNFALRACGKRVPEDYALLSFNDSELLPIQMPPVTAFNTHEERIAEALIELLFKRIEAPDSLVEHRVIQPELVIRTSTQP